jgi:hypothetical protein
MVTNYLTTPPVADLNMALDALRSLALLFPSPLPNSHKASIETALSTAKSTLLDNTTNKDILSKVRDIQEMGMNLFLFLTLPHSLLPFLPSTLPSYLTSPKACMVISNFNLLLSTQSSPPTIIGTYGSTPMVAIALLRGYVATYPFETVSSSLTVILNFYKSFSGFDVDVSIRFYALQATELLFSRFYGLNKDGPIPSSPTNLAYLEASGEIMDSVIMCSWENVGKSINQVLGSLFEIIVKIQVAFGDNLERTTAQAMKQPNHSKVRAAHFRPLSSPYFVTDEKLVLYIHACHMQWLWGNFQNAVIRI